MTSVANRHALSGNARVFGFEEGLGLKGTQFNDISTMFFVTYVVCEIPWVMAVKRWGANIVLALALISWSALTIGIGFVHNYAQAMVLRLLLGAAEAGLYPGLVFVISTIWPRTSQAKRVSSLALAAAISGAFGGLIAYGIQTMGDRLGIAAWRWLFIIEGVVSMVVGGISLFTLPKTAESAWFLNAEEKAVMIARKHADAVYKGPDEFDWKYVRMAFSDPFVYVTALVSMCAAIPLFGIVTFLPTLLKGMGYVPRLHAPCLSNFWLISPPQTGIPVSKRIICRSPATFSGQYRCSRLPHCRIGSRSEPCSCSWLHALLSSATR